MKRLFPLVAVCLLAAAPAPAQYVFSDGTNTLSPSRPIPSQGVSRSTGRVVVGLYGATPEVKADCGWYAITAARDIGWQKGYRIASNRWVFAATEATLTRWWKPAPFRNWEISKYRLLELAIAYGKLAELNALIDANPTNRILWDAAVTLDRTNALVTSAEAPAADALGISRAAVSNLLWEAKAQ